MSEVIQKPDVEASGHACKMTRRRFLALSGATAIATKTISLTLYPGAEAKAEVVTYPRQKIASLSALKDHEPVDFAYPDGNAAAMLVKMGGLEGGGGVGPQRDVVAFSYVCVHQGGPLQKTYKLTGDQCTMGQCPLHLSTYDMRRHGIVVSGQAYESLPQILLELDGDDIYAVGVMGLIYGRHQNIIS
ncbi:MAG: arsenate reductase (azurin) small subunit [Pseudomonadota bacterium]|nr:arsenate reductase (azurin) small subunit [Pseudomonadota bacterium]